MKALIQRVTQAHVSVNNETIGAIEQGLVVLLGIEKNDSLATVKKLADKVVNYRVFADANDKMNLSVKDIAGGLLVISQFTLAADTNSGRRPSFSSAALPEHAESLYEAFVAEVRAQQLTTATGSFGADMAVSLTNDGPVTFLLNVPA